MKMSEVRSAQEEVREILADAGIPLAPDAKVEIADFGLGKYRAVGLGLVVRVNEPEYCSKWLTLLPGQWCPWHHHDVKKETFFIHKGAVKMELPDGVLTLNPGDQYTMEPGTDHAFGSEAGAVVEEVSTHDENADSIFRDPNIVPLSPT